MVTSKEGEEQDAVDLDDAKKAADDEVPPCEGSGDSVDACDQSCGPKWWVRVASSTGSCTSAH